MLKEEEEEEATDKVTLTSKSIGYTYSICASSESMNHPYRLH